MTLPMPSSHNLDELGVDVSRETLQRLENYVELISKWNPAINLVSKKSMSEIWFRHIIDSAQLFPEIPDCAINCLDIGSGGGFPAIVLAIISAEKSTERKFDLIESDQRKSTFLREVARSLNLNIKVFNNRAEQLAPFGADFLSARALAPLPKLLELASRHLHPDGVCLFPKGETFMQEIAEAEKFFTFNCTIIPSKTDANCAALKISGIRHA